MAWLGCNRPPRAAGRLGGTPFLSPSDAPPHSLSPACTPAPMQRGLAVTDRLGLLGASVTQHPDFEQLLAWLMEPERAHVRLSIASVRTNTVTPALAAALSSR